MKTIEEFCKELGLTTVSQADGVGEDSFYTFYRDGVQISPRMYRHWPSFSWMNGYRAARLSNKEVAKELLRGLVARNRIVVGYVGKGMVRPTVLDNGYPTPVASLVGAILGIPFKGDLVAVADWPENVEVQCGL